MKIAFYLGSFNPFHNDHLGVVKSALNDFEMDRVIIVPTMQNPWKKEKVLDINKRVEIIKTVIENSLYGNIKLVLPFMDERYGIHYVEELSDRVEISEIEKELIPPYYGYATLHALKNKYCNDEIFILCGEDTIEKVPEWMHGEQIIKDYNFLVCDRPKGSISSTKIRNKVKNGEDISRYVNENVIDLIEKYYE